jgi:VWFA-related protein
VLVDVVVTNDKGEAVPGLQKNDFEVLEDGKPQTITTFEEHHGATPTEIKLPPMPPHVYTNYPLTKTADSVNVILLDALNAPSRDQTYVHWQMIKYLKTIPPGTRAAIFTLSSRLRMLQGVTTDPSELLAAINSPQAGTQPSGVLTSAEEAEELHHFIGFLEASQAGPTSAPQNRGS